MKKQFRIVYTVADAPSTSERMLRNRIESESDDIAEFCDAVMTSRNTTAKIQERINIALPHENGGRPLWVWRDLE